MTQHIPVVERVRHDLKFRLAHVVSVKRVTPKMARITLTGDDFDSFVSLAYDDHCKVFFPLPGKSFAVPQPGENGLDWPDGERPPARDYTPRFYDNAARTLVLDFVLHGDGPASEWAAAARPGDVIGVGGPRGSFVVRAQFDWYVLIGDETALPAISRRIEELPRQSKVFAVVEVADNGEIQKLDAPLDAEIHWLSREGERPGDAARLLGAAMALELPKGEGYVFVAGESAMSKAVRAHFIDQRAHHPDHIKAAGYWQAGSSDFDDGHAH